MTVSTVRGDGYKHRVFASQSVDAANYDTALFLIDGDGRAFIGPTLVARDPTPRRSRMVALAPTLNFPGVTYYIGRPCYHDLGAEPGCGPRAWTLDRFSESTVASLSAVILQLLGPNQRAVVLGYSGGGPLAMLVATQLAQHRVDAVRAVLTYAAPLDVQAWASWHGYTPLAGSLDPAAAPEASMQFCQRHLYGLRDREIPPELVSQWRYGADVPASMVTMVDSDHTCCWARPVVRALAQLLLACP